MLSLFPTVDTTSCLLNRKKWRWNSRLFHTIFNERVGDALVNNTSMKIFSIILKFNKKILWDGVITDSKLKFNRALSEISAYSLALMKTEGLKNAALP